MANKQYITARNGAKIIPIRRFLNLNLNAMVISDFGLFRPATQMKDFDSDFKEFEKQRTAFLELIQEAVIEDRVFKICRKNYAEALAAILNEDSPILREIKDGFVEVSFVIKLK